MQGEVSEVRMKIVKNLTFTVPKPIWETRRSFILLETDKTDRNIRALLRWNPVLTKAEYKIKVVNATTKEYYRHTLIRTELLDDNRYIIACWNPHETLDIMTGLIPTLIAVGILASVINYLKKRTPTIK
jgi:hypothetical protein